jgi:hypothetical protein
MITAIINGVRRVFINRPAMEAYLRMADPEYTFDVVVL